MKPKYRTGDELRAEVFALIARELGPDALIQFLRDNVRGSGDYTRDRDAVLPERSVDEWAAEIEKWRKHGGAA